MVITKDEIREAAEASLFDFIRLIAPHRVLGDVHRELIEWWGRSDSLDHQLTLLPRDHQKSAMLGYRVAWELTRNPWMTFLYISATTALAEKQLYFIKNIFTSKIHRRYWPELIHPDEGKREKWTSTEIIVDHPDRKAEGVRDSSIMVAGLTTNITGFHFNVAALDDVVIRENAYNQEGREKVKSQYSLLASIETTGSREWVVGTRYNQDDLYGELVGMEEEEYTDEGEHLGSRSVYEVFERTLEDSPNRDGTGEYLWPKQQRADGKAFGFNIQERARKYAKYLDKAQFYAQYYNDPTDPENSRIRRNMFQYYKQELLNQSYGYWYFKEKKINVYAAMDFAYTDTKKADYSTIVVFGVDGKNNIYVLDIDRFKTSKISVMSNHLFALHNKWGFRKLRAESTAGQGPIVNELKVYMKEEGLVFSIDHHNPTRHDGSKRERINAALVPRYDNLMIWHYRGGNCQILEDELLQTNPAHEDVSDALAAGIEIAKAPSGGNRQRKNSSLSYNGRFGGVQY